MGQEISIKLSGRTCLLADVRKYPLAAYKANSYVCPLGPEPGWAWVLMLYKDLKQLSATGTHTLQFAAGPAQVTIKNLRIEKATRVRPAASLDPGAAYLVELADPRLLLERFTDVNRSFNVRVPAAPSSTTNATSASEFYAASLNAGAIYTWTTLAETIWQELPSAIVGAFPGGIAGAIGTPENFRFHGVSAWQALHTVLAKIDHTTAYDPVAGTFSIVQLGSTQAGLPAWQAQYRPKILDDAEPIDGTACQAPETIRVYFNKLARHFGTEPDTQRTAGNWVDSGAMHSEDVPSGIAGAVAGTVVTLFDDMAALADYAGALNTSDLSARASQRAADYVDSITGSGARMRRVYQGVAANFRVGSQVNAILYRNYGDGLVTEVSRHPGLQGLRASPERRPAPGNAGLLSGPGAAGAGENLAPSDLARRTFPQAPRNVQLVRVVNATKDPASGLFAGKVLRADPAGNFSGSTAYTDGEDCWLADLVGDAEHTVDQRYVGRLNGVAASSSIVRPLYLIQGASETQTPKRFELTARLQIGSFAAAEEVVWNGTTWVKSGDVIEVWDFQKRHFGLAGQRGWAILRIDSGKYEVIDIADTLLRGVIINNLPSDLSPELVSLWTFDGANEVDSGVLVKAAGWFDFLSGFAGEKCWVRFHESSNRWYVIAVDAEPGLPFYNDSGETIPIGAWMRSSGYDPALGMLKMQKPSDTFSRIYYINLGREVPYQTTGVCSRDWFELALLNVPLADTATDKGVGPVSGQWGASQFRPGGTIVGIQGPIVPACLVSVHEINMLQGVLDTELMSDDPAGPLDEAFMTVWYGPPNLEAASTHKVKVSLWEPGAPLPAGTRVTAYWIHGNWYAKARTEPTRFELTALLSPQSSAAAKIVLWDGANWVATGAVITVWDYNGHHAGLIGDRGWCFFKEDSGRYEIIELGGTLVRGKLDGEITAGGSQVVSLWRFDGAAEVDTLINVTAWDWLIACGSVNVSSLSGLSEPRVWVKYDEGSDRWYVAAYEPHNPSYAALIQGAIGLNSTQGFDRQVGFATAEPQRDTTGSTVYERITIGCPGVYEIHATGNFKAQTAVGSGVRGELYFTIDSVGIFTVIARAKAFQDNWTNLALCRRVRLSAGSTIELWFKSANHVITDVFDLTDGVLLVNRVD